MKKLVIHRYFGSDQTARTIEIPVRYLKTMPGLLPRSVILELEKEQIELEELITAADTNDVSGLLMGMSDQGKKTRIDFFVEN